MKARIDSLEALIGKTIRINRSKGLVRKRYLTYEGILVDVHGHIVCLSGVRSYRKGCLTWVTVGHNDVVEEVKP